MRENERGRSVLVRRKEMEVKRNDEKDWKERVQIDHDWMVYWEEGKIHRFCCIRMIIAWSSQGFTQKIDRQSS